MFGRRTMCSHKYFKMLSENKFKITKQLGIRDFEIYTTSLAVLLRSLYQVPALACHKTGQIPVSQEHGHQFWLSWFLRSGQKYIQDPK